MEKQKKEDVTDVAVPAKNDSPASALLSNRVWYSILCRAGYLYSHPFHPPMPIHLPLTDREQYEHSANRSLAVDRRSSSILAAAYHGFLNNRHKER